MKIVKYTLPFILFISIVFLLARGLSLHPSDVPSPLINEPAPSFALSTLFDSKKALSNKDFTGHISLLVVWASWCPACVEEHEFLLQIANNPDFVLYGLDYKDSPEKAKEWLAQRGNPYHLIAMDQLGDVAIDWGVYGTPETFIIDQQGVIRYKKLGAITSESWQQELLPVIMQLKQEKK